MHDINKIEQAIIKLLMDDTISNYQIAKDTGISKQTLGNYTRKSNIDSMSFAMARTLYAYYQKVKDELPMTTRYTVKSGIWSTTIDAMDLDDAKEQAYDLIAYNGDSTSDFVILSATGEELSRARWYGCQAGEDDEVLADFAQYGFFAQWQE